MISGLIDAIYASYRELFIKILHHILRIFMCINLNNVQVMFIVKIIVLLMFLYCLRYFEWSGTLEEAWMHNWSLMVLK